MHLELYVECVCIQIVEISFLGLTKIGVEFVEIIFFCATLISISFIEIIYFSLMKVLCTVHKKSYEMVQGSIRTTSLGFDTFYLLSSSLDPVRSLQLIIHYS